MALHSHLPRICKFSMDIDAFRYYNEISSKINFEFLTEKSNLNIEEYLKCVIKQISSLNNINVKSLLIYYNNDLENRCSHKIEDENSINGNDEFIKYDHDNTDITKDVIFSNLKEISSLASKIIIKELDTNIELKEFIKFMYYMDSKYFMDIFSLFLVANFEKLISSTANKKIHPYQKNHMENYSKNCKFSLNDSIANFFNNPILKKEIKILQDNLGF